MTEEEDKQERDICVPLYELSEMPQFQSLIELLMRIAAQHRAGFPRTVDQKVAYESSNAVSNTIREIMDGLQKEISIGRRIATHETPGGEPDADDGTNKRRRT